MPQFDWLLVTLLGLSFGALAEVLLGTWVKRKMRMEEE